MSNCCEESSTCAPCCTVTENFWMYMWGILGALGILLLFFWFNPSYLVQLTSNLGGVYTFEFNALGANALKNGAATTLAMFGTPEDLAEFQTAMCRGNIWLWLLLGGSFLAGLVLSRMIAGNPSQFVCCKSGV